MRKFSNPRQSVSSVLHCVQYTYWFLPSKEPDSSVRRSPIWNILVQSALSITSRPSGLLRIVQKDVTNWRLASADCVSGPSLRFVVQSPLLARRGNRLFANRLRIVGCVTGGLAHRTRMSYVSE